jgi:high-affinity Fe2+/Pb2+ permease
MDKKREHWWLPWGDYPPVIILMVAATLINILIFVTGKSSLPEIFNSEDSAILILVILFCVLAGLWLSCLHFAFRRTKPLLEGGGGVWKYPRLRSLALVVHHCDFDGRQHQLQPTTAATTIHHLYGGRH